MADDCASSTATAELKFLSINCIIIVTTSYGQIEQDNNKENVRDE